MGDLRGSEYEDQPRSTYTPNDTSKKYVEACKAAEGLIKLLAEKHYPKIPNFRPQSGDLVGMILQLDNMTAGLERPKPQEIDAAALRNIQVNARFEVSSGLITGTTHADVKRVEFEDDGSLTVVIDHWPNEPRMFP
jgi:hypothetical protein